MIEKKLLFSPGPVITSERVKKAALNPDICHRNPIFEELYINLRKKIIRLFKANEKNYTSVVVSGSGTASNEMVLSSVVEKNEKVLLITNGEFGNRLREIIECYNINLNLIEYNWGEYPKISDIEKELKDDKAIKLVAMVFHETSTGMINPIHEVGEIAKKYGKMYFIDAISAIGGEDVDVVRDNIDFCTGVPNKSVAGPPGMSFVCVNRNVMDKIKNIKRKNIYLNLQTHLKFAEEINQTPNTPAVVQFLMLDAALDELFKEGLENRFERYKSLARIIREEINKMNLEILLKDEKYMSNTVTSVFLHSNYNLMEFIKRMDDEGYVLYPGKGPLFKKNMFQIANMGQLTKDDTLNMLKTLKETLKKLH